MKSSGVSWKERRKSSDLSRCRHSCSDADDCTSSDQLFQAGGEAAAKARSPIVEQLVVICDVEYAMYIGINTVCEVWYVTMQRVHFWWTARMILILQSFLQAWILLILLHGLMACICYEVTYSCQFCFDECCRQLSVQDISPSNFLSYSSEPLINSLWRVGNASLSGMEYVMILFI